MNTLTIAAVLLLTAFTLTAAIAEAKGPPGKVTISGPNLTADVIIDRPDLVQIDNAGDFATDNTRTPYSPNLLIPNETPYRINIYANEPGSAGPTLFLAGNYYLANAAHPALLSDDSGLWKANATFAALLDTRIKAAQAPAALPSAGGPPTNNGWSTWTYVLLAAAALTLLAAATAALRLRKP